MKKQIAKLLRSIADKIYAAPKIGSLLPPSNPIQTVKYEEKKLGFGYMCTRYEVMEFCARAMGKDPYAMSYEEMKSAYIADAKDRINKGIFMAIEKDGLIEYRIDDRSIVGFIYLNIPKNNETAHN